MANRQTKKVIQNITPAMADNAFADYSKACSNLKKLEADMELKLTKVRESFAPALEVNNQVKETNFAILQTFALENEPLFEKKKSYEMTHGTIGFRTGTPGLKTLKGFTWKSVVNLVKEFLPDYVRTVEEVNKESLLAARDTEEVAKLFTKCGIEVRQDESFFVQEKEEALT